MPNPPKIRSTFALRAFVAAVAVILLLLVGIAGLGAALYAELDMVFSGQPGETGWFAFQDAALNAAYTLWPYALGMLVVVMIVAWLFARRVARPVQQLVATTQAHVTGDTTQPLPTRASGEVGALARHFADIEDAQERAARAAAEDHDALRETIRHRDEIQRMERELHASLDADQIARRCVAILRDTFAYESAGVALVSGDALLLHHSGMNGTFAPPQPVPSSGSSIAACAAQKKALVYVADIRLEPDLDATPGLPGTRAELAMPASKGDETLAVISLQSSLPGTFSPHDEQRLTALAEPLASALANANAFRTEHLRRQRAEAIYRVSQTLGASLAPESVPDLILDQIGLVLPTERSALLLTDGDILELAAARGFGGQPQRGRLPLEDMPLLAAIVEHNQPLRLGEAQHDTRYRQIDGASAAASWMGVPIFKNGRVFGALMLESDEPNHYGDSELRTLTALANQAAIALENARLQAEAQERSLQLEVVTRVTQEVSTRDVSRELPGLLRTIIHQIRRVVPCDYAALSLLNDDGTFAFETVYHFAVRDWNELPPGTRVAPEGTPWQTACRTLTPLVQTELAQSTFAYHHELALGGLRSGVSVPIVGANRAIGTLDFASREPGAYGPTQVATLRELSHYLGTALHNARLSQEREETAAKLARTQEHLNLVDKVRAVGQLASGVAHDFNNLLGGILGNAQLLLYEIDGEEQKEMLRVIVRAAKDGAETVRRLQGFARMEHNSPLSEVRLDLLARDAIDITRPRWRDVAQSRGATIVIERQLDVVPLLAGRPSELREVLTNLIINAVDAMPAGGVITVTTHEDAEAGDVLVEIADTGTGMTPEVRQRIFDPFFTTKGEQGTGLGLAVSLGIVQSHGGTIDVASKPGEGTRFILRLPTRAQAHSAASMMQQRIPDVQPGHLLFVESEQMIREATARLLTRWGHKVATATDGTEALTMFIPDTFDLVISDLGMPDMNGWELLGEIKRRDPRVPTVLITGWGRQTTDEENRERGVDFVIEKPFDQDDLRAILAAALGGH